LSTRTITPDGVHPDERLGQDDMATRREGEFLAAALRQQAARAAKTAATAGSCANCGEACLPQTVYCDADCRADHEARLRVQARQGGVAR
jgi:hypothetical protein